MPGLAIYPGPTPPGGTSGQYQYNSAGVFGGGELTRLSASITQLGGSSVAAPTALTFRVGDSARAGTDSDTAGGNGVFQSGVGTGAGAASSIVFQTPTVGGAGSAAQSMATRLTVATVSIQAAVPVTIAGGTVTVSTPALSITQTWNAGAQAFKGVVVDVTNTSSAAGARLLSLQVATNEKASWNVDGAFFVDSNQVVGARQTGWGAPSGATSKITFDTTTVTLPQLAERVAALINDLFTHGLIGL